MDLETIRKHINAGDADDEMRAALADSILNRLEARGDELTAWERYHFGTALDILCSQPLRLTWAHVESACTFHDPIVGDKGLESANSIPGKRELWAKLIEVMWRIREQEVKFSKMRANTGASQYLSTPRDISSTIPRQSAAA